MTSCSNSRSGETEGLSLSAAGAGWPSIGGGSGAEDIAAKIAAIQSSAEAAAAAAALRACPDAPNNLSAQLQVHHRRGTVLMVDGETFDDQNPWHTCVRRELGHLEFPSTRTPVKARIRFSLR